MVILTKTSWYLQPQGKQIKGSCFRDLCQIPGNNEESQLCDKVAADIFMMFSLIQHTHCKTTSLSIRNISFHGEIFKILFRNTEPLQSPLLRQGRGYRRGKRNFDLLKQMQIQTTWVYLQMQHVGLIHTYFPQRAHFPLRTLFFSQEEVLVLARHPFSLIRYQGFFFQGCYSVYGYKYLS